MTTTRGGNRGHTGSGLRCSGTCAEGERAACFTRDSSSPAHSEDTKRVGFSTASTAPAVSASSR